MYRNGPLPPDSNKGLCKEFVTEKFVRGRCSGLLIKYFKLAVQAAGKIENDWK